MQSTSWNSCLRVVFSLPLLVVLLLSVAPLTEACSNIRNCANCSATVPTQCGICSNSKYLLEGDCVTACPSGYAAAGTGRFNRVCSKIFNCTALRDSCFQCNANRTACVMCAHSKYLSLGKCVSACPERSYGRGTGRFNRVCIPDPATPCQTLKNNCFLCDPTNTRCLTCTRGKVIHDGRCIERADCPSQTHSVRGTGQFRLRCLPINITANTTCTAANCFSCPTDVNVCEDCVPKRVLSNSTCVTSCPSSSVRMPAFGASPVCVPTPSLPASCQPGIDNCLACSDTSCMLCDGTRALFQGVCLEACPTGTLHTKSAVHGRRCS